MDGSRSVLVGVTSYGVGTCASLTGSEGFAKVSHVLDWIRENGDDYVRQCSANLGK